MMIPFLRQYVTVLLIQLLILLAILIRRHLHMCFKGFEEIALVSEAGAFFNLLGAQISG